MYIGPGSTGGGVADFQRRLQALGFAPGPIDGVYGPQTAKAIQSFQQASGINADGVVGPVTEQAFTRYGMQVGQSTVPIRFNQWQQKVPTNPTHHLGPEDDPQYLLFAAGQGYKENEARAYTAMRQSAISRAFQDELPAIQFRGQQERDKIADDMSNRGMWNSGERVKEQAQSMAQQQADITKLQNASNDQKNDLQAQLEENVADLRMQTQQASLNAAKGVSLSTAAQGGETSTTNTYSTTGTPQQ